VNLALLALIRRTTSGVEPPSGSVYFGGTPPLGVQPYENSQRAHFHRTSADDLEAQNTSVVDCRSICAPYHPACSDQTSQALFRGTADKTSLALGFVGRLRHGRVDRLLRQIKIAFASPVPADLVILTVFGHCPYSATRTAVGACYRSECIGGCGKAIPPTAPVRCARDRSAGAQYSGGCPSGRVFHRRCTHNHWSGYFRT
jgi:hypothetical protein